MSVSDAEHQNQYFVDTGADPLTSLYALYRKRRKERNERENRIIALEKQIVELEGQLQQAQTKLTETIRESKELLQQEVNRVKTNQGSKIIRLEAQISNSKLQNLCKETTFACELLKMAVESVPQEIVNEDGDLRVLAPCIQKYIEQHASLAEDLLKNLLINTDENGNLKTNVFNDKQDKVFEILPKATEQQHKVFKILLELMFCLIKNKHFNTSVYKDVMTNYFNTHASNSPEMIEPELEVDKMLNAEENRAR
jgi:hypothetical protein